MATRKLRRPEPAAPLPEGDISRLRSIFGSRLVLCDQRDRERYSLDQVADTSLGVTPSAVVLPTSTEQVSQLMKWANETGTPVTPRGGGSGLAGAAIPPTGGVVCSFEKMNRILEIDPVNMMAVVEPGVVTNTLDAALAPHGLFFAGYPMSEDICYIGGNVAENAGGGRAVRYGTTGTWVTGAHVVTPVGEVLRLGGKRIKDVTGYDLLHLMVGSEGTLGLFTQITIRVIPRPAVRGVLLLAFPDSTAAAAAVAALKRSPALSALEFMDGETARAANDALPRRRRITLPAEAGAFLLVEFDGPRETEVAREITEAAGVAEQLGAAPPVAGGTDAAGAERAWALRKAVPWWVKRSAPGYHLVEDVVVPPAEVPALVAHADYLRREYGIPLALFGHAGDGNFHINPMKPPEMAPAEWSSLSERLQRDLYLRVIDLGGTISGEHGIGRKRARYLSLALSPAELAAMRTVKKALDPKNVLNPGVIFES